MDLFWTVELAGFRIEALIALIDSSFFSLMFIRLFWNFEQEELNRSFSVYVSE